jgi:hypothetical protein
MRPTRLTVLYQTETVIGLRHHRLGPDPGGIGPQGQGGGVDGIAGDAVSGRRGQTGREVDRDGDQLIGDRRPGEVHAGIGQRHGTVGHVDASE